MKNVSIIRHVFIAFLTAGGLYHMSTLWGVGIGQPVTRDPGWLSSYEFWEHVLCLPPILSLNSQVLFGRRVYFTGGLADHLFVSDALSCEPPILPHPRRHLCGLIFLFGSFFFSRSIPSVAVFLLDQPTPRFYERLYLSANEFRYVRGGSNVPIYPLSIHLSIILSIHVFNICQQKHTDASS